ncbi:MAG TPA: hypothetical protein VFB73_08295 [Chloroflexota bacterium]|nr:hypothetical protein [Chloroflexota bacterium]
MVRRALLRGLLTAVLLGAGLLLGAVERVQAQVVDCSSWQARGAACEENRFNMNPVPATTSSAPPAIVVLPRPPAGAAGDATSQAAPQGETQAAAEE